MISLLVKVFIKDSKNVTSPAVKQAYATLSSIVGIALNLLLCTAKIIIGYLSNSVAISADGFNNLSDAGTSFLSFVGFKIARYGGGSVHSFGHGRIEWIMGIITSLAVFLMGIKLADTSFAAIRNPENLLFSIPVIVVLVLSIFIKGYMYFYNKKFSKIADSETLKATATDCISDVIATFSVLISTILSHTANWNIDGYCGVLVSVFIMVAGIKSLWEVLGRIMGKATDSSVINDILHYTKSYPVVISVHNLMLHDYGFGYFVISMKIAGYKEDREQLYISSKEISDYIYNNFHCDCFIQTDYLIDDESLTKELVNRVYLISQKYSSEISINNFRLIDGGSFINIVFDMLYPAVLQKKEQEICAAIETEIKQKSSKYHTTIKGIIRRERFDFRG